MCPRGAPKARVSSFRRVGWACRGKVEAGTLGGVTLDVLAALRKVLLTAMARMREDVDAMGRSLPTLQQPSAELRREVTRLRERVDRLERIALRLALEAR